MSERPATATMHFNYFIAATHTQTVDSAQSALDVCHKFAG